MPMNVHKGRIRAGAAIRLLPAAVAFMLLLPPEAGAQSSEMQSLVNRVDRLQRELSDLQRQFYGGGGAAVVSGAEGSSLAASQEVRLQQLESQLRTLTGQMEETSFRVQQMSERLDKLVADVDFRLRALEQGSGVPVAGAAAQTYGTAPPPGSQTTAAPPPAPEGGQVLGTLTQQQLDAQAGAAAPPPAPAAQTAAMPFALPGNTPDEQYKYAFDLLRQANYPDAEAALRTFIQMHPDDPLAGNAQYWLGETYYVRGDYTQAAVAFAEGYQRYPNSGKAADNLLKLGMSLGEIGQKDDACSAFAQLSKQFPGAPSNVKDRATRERKKLGCA